MPLYEYQCAKCGRFERIRLFADPPLATCPTCGGEDIQKLLSAPAIQFKGSGWYITDYARKGAGGSSDGKSESKSNGDSSSSKDSSSKDSSSKESSSSSSSDSSTPSTNTSSKDSAASGSSTN